jgi:recombination protein RecT
MEEESKMEKNYNGNNLAKTNNQVGQTQQGFGQFMATVGNKLVESTLQDPARKQQFVANLVTAVANNPTLRECDQLSVVSAALQAEALHFPINNSLGYVYLVPFNDKKRGCKVAQFQIGYKGYIQLAIRSGQYKSINVVEVKEGELGEYDPLNGQSFHWIKDYATRKAAKTIGYVGQFELVNGFKTQLYISYEEMLDHADTYSQAFSAETYKQLIAGTYKGDAWKLSSFWYKDFDSMSKKTVLRQLLSKWGIMSVEMQEAFIKDQAEMKENGDYEYIDNPKRDFAKPTKEEVVEQQQEETGTEEPPLEVESSDFDV